MKKQILAAMILLTLTLVLALALSGCGKQTAESAPIETVSFIEESSKPAYIDENKMKAAFDEIYKDSSELVKETLISKKDATLKDILSVESFTEVSEYYFMSAAGKYGIADVYILKPREGQEAVILSALEAKKSARMAEFERYDIYNAYQIAKDGLIIEMGGYYVLSMMPDNKQVVMILKNVIM